MKPLLLLLCTVASAATIQPDYSVNLPGPTTLIDPPLNVTIGQLQSQYPQGHVELNPQGTLGLYFEFPESHIGVFAPLATDWTAPTGPVTITIPEVRPIPSVPEPSISWLVSGAILLWCGNRGRHKR